jgi:hypothetical protein
MTKDLRISLDGVNVMIMNRGDVIDNPSLDMLLKFKGFYTKIRAKPSKRM